MRSKCYAQAHVENVIKQINNKKLHRRFGPLVCIELAKTVKRGGGHAKDTAML